MNDDRRSVLDHVRNRIDWVDESIRYDKLSDPSLIDIYIDDLEYARGWVYNILKDEEASYYNMPGGFAWGPNGFESLSAQEDLKSALKEFDTLIPKVKTFKEKYSEVLSREYNEDSKEERNKIAVKLRRLMKRYISRITENLRPYSLNPPVKYVEVYESSE